MTRTCILGCIGILVFLTGVAQAQNQSATSRSPESSDFARGTWSVQSYGTYMDDLDNRKTRLAGGTLGVGYYLFDGIGLNLEGSGYSIDEPGPNGAMGSVGILLRDHLIISDHWSFFIDVGGAVAEADERVPIHGTDFNFIFHSGPGVALELDKNVYLLAGVRYFHLSNAEQHGEVRNPSLNGPEGYVGLMFTF